MAVTRLAGLRMAVTWSALLPGLSCQGLVGGPPWAPSLPCPDCPEPTCRDLHGWAWVYDTDWPAWLDWGIGLSEGSGGDYYDSGDYNYAGSGDYGHYYDSLEHTDYNYAGSSDYNYYDDYYDYYDYLEGSAGSGDSEWFYEMLSDLNNSTNALHQLIDVRQPIFLFFYFKLINKEIGPLI